LETRAYILVCNVGTGPTRNTILLCAVSVRLRSVASRQSERSKRNERCVELLAHVDATVAVDVVRGRVMSGTDVHRSVSVLRQTRLRHVQWNLQRAAAVRQSTATRLDHSQAETGSAGHCSRLQELFAGV